MSILRRAERSARHLLLALLLLGPLMAKAQTASVPLELEAKIPLGPVSGRIDHLAIDIRRQWLFVAELGNDNVGVIDVANRKLISTMRHLVAWIRGAVALSPTRVPGYAMRTYSGLPRSSIRFST